MKGYAPIIIFAYNRVDHLDKTIRALEAAEGVEETDCFIWCDGCKSEQDCISVNEVRKYIHYYKTISRFNTVKIYENATNKGLANSVIAGVNKVLEEYNKVIVVEDDMIVSCDFLVYMNDALEFYEGAEEVFSVGGWAPDLPILKDYNKDVFFQKRFECWGWGIWKDRWITIEWRKDNYLKASKEDIEALSVAGRDIIKMFYAYLNREIDSWAIRVACHLVWTDKYTVVPSRSKVKNIGLDGSGTNCGIKEMHLAISTLKVDFIPWYRDDALNLRLWLYYSYGKGDKKLSVIDRMRYKLHLMQVI